MKTLTTSKIQKLILVGLAAWVLPGCSVFRERQVTQRTDPTRDSVTQVNEGYDTFGRKWGETQTTQVAKTPAPAEAPRPRSSDGRLCGSITTGLVNMTKNMPAEVTVGQEFMYELNPNAVTCAGNVIVTDRVPTGASYVRSEPAAQVQGDRLVWNLGDLEAGATQSIKVWLKAEQEGKLASCATLAADPRVCASTLVGKPALAISKSGPETAVLGSTITYNVIVSNTGSAVVHDVVVTDPVPSGLGGTPVSVNVGDLGPNQSKTIPVSFTADQRGRFCNVATADSSNAGKVTAEACTVVLQGGVKITKEGVKEQFLGRPETYDIVVSNTGDTALTGVVVTDTAPAGTTVMAADGGSVSGNTITWNVGDLAKGDTKSFKAIITTMTPGHYCNSVSVATAQGLKDTAEACTDWRGVSALLLEKGDNPDPIQVGEQTTYFVRVTNQGTAPDADVKVVVQFPKELTPVTADNGGTVDGQTVTFPPVAHLDAKQAFEYHVTAKGAAPGDARVTFIRTSRDIPAPTTAQESTRVY